jgi:linoleate 10R-lipoxygenase
MFRRLSKTFNKKKDSNKEALNGNGKALTNGVTPAHESQSSSDHESSAAPSATREDVQTTFEQYAQLIHAAQRPLPNQSGDGAYLEKEEPSGVWADIKSLGLKDVRTVRNMMEDKASGKPQDDKLMHMEHIMQVGTGLSIPAGCED